MLSTCCPTVAINLASGAWARMRSRRATWRTGSDGFVASVVVGADKLVTSFGKISDEKLGGFGLSHNDCLVTSGNDE